MDIGDRIEFDINEANGIWLASRELGGLTYEGLASLIWNEDPETAEQFILEQKVFMSMDLYQDDGYRVRAVMGKLNQQESEEWVACVRWKLNLPTGQMIVSGALDTDEAEFIAMPSATELEENDFTHECYVEVPPAEYQVEVYSYAPYDLSSGWEQIIGDEDSWCSPTEGIEREPLRDYFYRTRPDIKLPAWIAYEISDDSNQASELYQASIALSYVNFIIRLSPVIEDTPIPELEGSSLKWQFRKPSQCPLGIPSMKN